MRGWYFVFPRNDTPRFAPTAYFNGKRGQLTQTPFLHVRENQVHFSSFRSTPLPAFSCAAAESRRLALAGVRRR